MHHAVQGGGGLAPDTVPLRVFMRALRHQHHLQGTPTAVICTLAVLKVLLLVIVQFGSATHCTGKTDQEQAGDEHQGHNEEQKKARDGGGGVVGGQMVDQC